MTRRLLVLLVALGTVLAFAAPSMGDTYRIKARGEPGTFRWRPAEQHGSKGDRIVWKNPTDVAHTVTAYSNNWSKDVTVRPGERVSKRFRRKGAYLYRCTRPGHSTLSGGDCNGMCGKIHIM